MAVIETPVSRKPASFMLHLILSFISLVLLNCHKPPSSAAFVSKAPFSVTIPSTGLSESDEYKAEEPPHAKSLKYSKIVRKYADRYNLDWVLILSVMKQESQFKPNAVSNVGAYGLMQIMPITEGELTLRLGVREARTPGNNIKAGTFHLRSLYRIFRNAEEEHRVQLTLASYNAGLGRVLDARQIAAYLGEDANDWNAVKKALPLLSKRYHTLHKNIWEEGRPPSGYFRNWRQTTKYVEKVLGHYDEFSMALR